MARCILGEPLPREERGTAVPGNRPADVGGIAGSSANAAGVSMGVQCDSGRGAESLASCESCNCNSLCCCLVCERNNSHGRMGKRRAGRGARAKASWANQAQRPRALPALLLAGGALAACGARPELGGWAAEGRQGELAPPVSPCEACSGRARCGSSPAVATRQAQLAIGALRDTVSVRASVCATPGDTHLGPLRDALAAADFLEQSAPHLSIYTR